jgi:hypothetical protein
MIGTREIEDFAARTRANGRILGEDLRRLRRLVLPHGVASRRQAEMLLALEGDIGCADDAFRAFLVDEIARFVVWDDRPTGRLDESKIAWLCAVLGREWPTQTAAAIAAAVLEESGAEIPELAAIAGRGAPRLAAFRANAFEDAQYSERASVRRRAA